MYALFNVILNCANRSPYSLYWPNRPFMPESMRIWPLSNSYAELTYGEYGTSNDDTSV